MTLSDARTPDELLAAAMARQLVAEGLVPAAKQEELQRKLASGTATAADWRGYVEMTAWHTRRRPDVARRIERIQLRNFRGALGETTIAFDPAKAMIVIFGENGAGKSTLIDAIDLVCNKWRRSPSAARPRRRRICPASSARRGCQRHPACRRSGVGRHAGQQGIEVAGAAPTPVVHILRRNPVPAVARSEAGGTL